MRSVLLQGHTVFLKAVKAVGNTKGQSTYLEDDTRRFLISSSLFIRDADAGRMMAIMMGEGGGGGGGGGGK